jgi:hypothetical protein
LTGAEGVAGRLFIWRGLGGAGSFCHSKVIDD